MRKDRITKEKETITMMLKIYCKKHHHSKTLCEECVQLEIYAYHRLDNCRFANQKPTCKNCPIHCYSPEMREKIKEVMHFSGPRLLFHHPIKAIEHLLLDNTKK